MKKLKGKRLSSIPFSIYFKIKSFYLKQNLKSVFKVKLKVEAGVSNGDGELLPFSS